MDIQHLIPSIPLFNLFDSKGVVSGPVGDSFIMNSERMKIGSPPRSRGPSRSASRSRPSSTRRSPSRIQQEDFRECDTTSETYISATKKLSEAAWRYDREKDPGFIHNLENRELEKEDFRRILKIGLDCRLTREELDSLMPLYDYNGKVDGFEFILTFYHLRFENRGIQLTTRVVAERRLKDALITGIELKSAQHEEKSALQLIDQVLLDREKYIEEILCVE